MRANGFLSFPFDECFSVQFSITYTACAVSGPIPASSSSPSDWSLKFKFGFRIVEQYRLEETYGG